jgi:two-component system OmpR family sensor kinase
MILGGSLSRRLALLVSLGFAAIWLFAVGVTAIFVLREELEELASVERVQAAGILLPVASYAYRQGLIDEDTALPQALIEPEGGIDASLIFALVDGAGTVLVASPGARGTDLPPGPPTEGQSRTEDHAFYTTPPDKFGLSLMFGDPLSERREAYLEGFLTFLAPMLAILPLGFLLVGWIARTALRPLGDLREEIARRGDTRLDPIDAAGQPDELKAITASLNGFMIRLSRALEGERTFATNAAHELRSPVAIALAQVQRLKVEPLDPAARDRVDRLETALQRMRSLVARLLQLARADAGIGPATAPQDVGELLRLVIDEVARDPARVARLRVSVPSTRVLSPIDPDAFAIVAGNLLENALQHGPAGTPIDVTLSAGGALSVVNSGPAIPAAELERLTERFHTGARSREGFGLGLYISDRIAKQAKGRLVLRSPAPGARDGLEAVFELPADETRTGPA